MFAQMTELGLPLPKDEKRRLGDEAPAASQLPELPDSFERESSKFWLQRGQVIPFVDMVTQVTPSCAESAQPQWHDLCALEVKNRQL